MNSHLRPNFRTLGQPDIKVYYRTLMDLQWDPEFQRARWKRVPRKYLQAAVSGRDQSIQLRGSSTQPDERDGQIEQFCSKNSDLLWYEEANQMARFLSVEFDSKFAKVNKTDQGISSIELDIIRFNDQFLDPSQMLHRTLVLDLRYKPPVTNRWRSNGPRGNHQFPRKNRNWISRAEESQYWRAQPRFLLHPDWLPKYLSSRYPVEQHRLIQPNPHHYRPFEHFQSTSPNTPWRVVDNAPADMSNAPSARINRQATISGQQPSQTYQNSLTASGLRVNSATSLVPQSTQTSHQYSGGPIIAAQKANQSSLIVEIYQKKPLKNSYRVVGHKGKQSVTLEPIDPEGPGRIATGDQRTFKAYLLPDSEIFEHCHRALSKLLLDGGHKLRRVLCELCDDYLIDYDDKQPLIDVSTTSTDQLESRLKRLNSDQQRAVKDILQAKFRAFPYIIIGGPGTGKTDTMIEAIVQIHMRAGDAIKVLVCSITQNSTDKLYERIVKRKVIDKSKLCRIPRDFPRADFITDADKRASLSDKSIFVTTTVRSDIFADKSFDYVFIDNASGAHEPETLVPWCKLKDDGCFVMVGDPNQLCTRVSNDQVNQGRLDGSMLERFVRYPIADAYDRRYICELVKSYRCDPRIMKSINWQPYNSRIELGKQITPKRILAAFKSPLVVVDTRNVRQSLAEVCRLYVQKIHDSQVKLEQMAVMTIAASDVLLKDLHSALKIKLKDSNGTQRCRIDECSDFTGDEPLDATVVVVGNSYKDEPFADSIVDNEHRRFNMAISRARWLVVMIGDFSRLDSESYWLYMIKNVADRIVLTS